MEATEATKALRTYLSSYEIEPDETKTYGITERELPLEDMKKITNLLKNANLRIGNIKDDFDLITWKVKDEVGFSFQLIYAALETAYKKHYFDVINDFYLWDLTGIHEEVTNTHELLVIHCSADLGEGDIENTYIIIAPRTFL
jgi:hypothetical protein